MNLNRVVPIFSGGLDSTILVYLMRARGMEVFPLAINYGQRHVKELASARETCDRLGLELEVADLSGIRHLLAGSSQTDDSVEVPEGHYAEESMKATVVPNRNMIMLSVAAGYALSIGASFVAYGAHGGDHAIYPDCRPVFSAAMDTVFQLCDWKDVRLSRPFVDVNKAAIVRIGHELGVPMHLTWSCYKGGELHCGKCGTCVERREAFKLAAVEDHTVYERETVVLGPDGAAASADAPRVVDVTQMASPVGPLPSIFKRPGQ